MASLQHLRTSTDSKRPIPAAMAAGQLALGLHTNSPGAFFKDTNGGLVKIGPVHVGTTSPNASPASEAATATVNGRSYQILTVGNTDFTAIGASANTVGTIFTASGAGTGTGTVSGLQGNSKGECWLDTSVSPPVFKVFNGTAFVTVHPPHIETNTTTPPSNPVVGQLWWNKDDGRIYIYMNDGSSAQWVDASPDNQQLFWTRTGTRVDLSNSGDVVTVSGGSASAPGLAVAGDLDTGISSSSANTLGISTGGTQRITVDSSGRVGINSTSPEERLHVNGAIVSTSTNSTSSVGGSNRAILDLTSGGARIGHFRGSTSAGSGYLGLFVDSSERMRIESSGYAKFNSGFVFVQSSASGSSDSDGLALISDTNADAYVWNYENTTLRFGTNATERLRIDSSGRLLVGTTIEGEATADNLTIADSGNCGITLRSGTAAVGTIFFSDATSGADEYRGVIQYDHNGDYFKWVTAGAERLRLDSAGRLGLGTSNPGKLLALQDSSTPALGFYTGATLRAEINATSAETSILSYANSPITFNIGGSAETEAVRIDSSGNVGIGSSNPASLGSGFTEVMVSGNTEGAGLQLQDTDGNVKAGLFTSDNSNTATLRTITNHPLTFRTNNTEAMRIDSAGNVGIGASDPTALLQVGSYSGNNGIQIGAGSGSTSYIHFGDAASGVGEFAGYVQYTHSTNALQFGTDSNERMRIDSSGNVGVNNSNPRGLIHVGADLASGATDAAAINLKQTSTTAATGIYLERSGERRGYAIYVGGDNDSLTFQRNNFGTKSDVMSMTRDGNVGIGESSPAANLEITPGTGNGTLLLNRASGSSADGALMIEIASSGAIYETRKTGGLAHIWYATGAEAMRIDTNGRMGLGNSSPSHRLSIAGTANNVNSEITITATSVASGYIGANANGLNLGTDTAGIVFKTGVTGGGSVGGTGTERMRIDSSGRLLVGATSGMFSGFTLQSTGSAGPAAGGACAFKEISGNAGNNLQVNWHTATSGDNRFIEFGTEGSFTNRGNISYNRSGNTIGLNSTSDARLKTNITDASSALNVLNQVQVRAFDWIEDGHDAVAYGFIAQELNEVVPFAVSVGDSGDQVAQAWGVDKASMVPVLTKALQEAIAKIETLEAKVAALEAG